MIHLARQQSAVSSSLQYQLQIDDIIIEVEHLLRGDVYDEIEGTWKASNNNEFRHMNELGIKRVSSILKTYLNRNDFLTTYEEDRILKKCILCVDNVANLFVLEGDSYAMKEEEYDLILWEIIMPNVESAIRRATNSMTLDAHSKMQMVSENIDRGRESQVQQQEEMSKWKLWR